MISTMHILASSFVHTFSLYWLISCYCAAWRWIMDLDKDKVSVFSWILSPVLCRLWPGAALSLCKHGYQDQHQLQQICLLQDRGQASQVQEHRRLWWENYGTAEIGGRLVLVWWPFGCGQPIVMNGHFGLDWRSKSCSHSVQAFALIRLCFVTKVKCD